MSESQDRQPTTTADTVLSGVLSEHVRQQYLSAMGIQVWYDPVAVCLSESAGREQPLSNDAGAETVPPGAKAEVAFAGALEAQKTINIRPVDSLAELSARVEQCQLCELHASRQQTVSGEGNAEAALMIITDAPVGDALLTAESKLMLQQMLRAINIDLSAAYLTSLVKCPPPEQRVPHTTEMICCDDHLSAQIKLIQPKVILVSGERASQQLLVSQKSLADLRLRQYQHQGIPVYASCHAQELPGSAASKRKVWQDLLQIKKILST